jgi:hypothetical protein
MPRYTSKPRSYVADDLEAWDGPMIAEIHVPENKPVNTGLLDADGNAIWRQPLPIGFGRMEDW